MSSFIVTIFLTFFGFSRVQEQASEVMTYASNFYCQYASVSLDKTNHLWIMYLTKNGLYVSRIAPDGKPVFNRIQICSNSWSYFSRLVAFDHWGNAYMCYGITPMLLDPRNEDDMIHLVRITPTGEFHDYYPWPEVTGERLNLEIIPGDSLYVIGSFGNRITRLGKAHIKEDGLNPLSTEDFDAHKQIVSSLQSVGDFRNFVVDWEDRYVVSFGIIPTNPSPYRDPNIMYLIRYDLTPPYNKYELEEHKWRDYVWRTFEDTWIGKMTVAPHKDGGYTLFIPEPPDHSTTYAIRLDDDFKLIDPSTLEGGGKKKTRSYNRLPETAEPNVDFRVIDATAQITFWDCDDEGNLYHYTTNEFQPRYRVGPGEQEHD